MRLRVSLGAREACADITATYVRDVQADNEDWQTGVRTGVGETDGYV